MIARVACLAALVAARPAAAQCAIDSVSPVAFGSYDPLSSAPLDSTGSVTYKCLLSLSVTIDVSTGSSASYAARTMKNAGGDALTYNLYLDAARLTVWGNAAGNGTVHYGPIIALLTAVTVPIFGRIPAKQDAAVGGYADTIVITLNY